MNDTPRHKRPDDWDPPMPSEAELLASLARSEAEFAAGQIVSGDEVLRELDESIARMQEPAVKPPKRVRLGNALAALGRKVGLTDEDIAAIDQMRDQSPASR
jgi:hypothetical protein